MRSILFDTNAYVSFKKNEPPIVEIIQQAESICMSPIVIGELIAGFDGGSKAKQNKIELQNFLESSRIVIYPITMDTSYFFFTSPPCPEKQGFSAVEQNIDIIGQTRHIIQYAIK